MSVEGRAASKSRARTGRPVGRHRAMRWFSAMTRLLLPGVATIVLVAPALAIGSLVALMRADFALSASEIGMIFASFFLCSAVSASLGERVASRDPVSVVHGAIICASLVCVVIAATRSKESLVVGCVVAGLANGLAAPALNLLILSSIPARRQGLAFGVRVAAAPTAAALAALSAVAVESSRAGWATFFWGIAVLGVGVLAALHHIRPRAAPRLPAGAPKASRQATPTSLRLIALGGLLGAWGSTVIASFLLVTLVDGGQDAGDAATLLAVSSWLVIGGRVAAGMISDRHPSPQRHVWIVAGMLLACAGGMVVLARDVPFGVVIVATVVAMGFGWSWPGLFHRAVITLHPKTPARATSLVQSSTYLGSVLGPAVFGLVADQGSYAAAWTVSALVAVVAALFLAMGVRRIDNEVREGHGVLTKPLTNHM